MIYSEMIGCDWQMVHCHGQNQIGLLGQTFNNNNNNINANNNSGEKIKMFVIVIKFRTN